MVGGLKSEIEGLKSEIGGMRSEIGKSHSVLNIRQTRNHTSYLRPPFPDFITFAYVSAAS